MRIEELDYHLPEELIAQVPLADRSSSRLLCLGGATGVTRHIGFRDIVGELHEGDLLVVNDTRVSALRLAGHKVTGGEVEALLLTETEPGLFECLLKPAKRLRPGTRVVFDDGLSGTVQEGGGGPVRRLRIDGQEWRAKLPKLGRPSATVCPIRDPGRRAVSNRICVDPWKRSSADSRVALHPRHLECFE